MDRNRRPQVPSDDLVRRVERDLFVETEIAPSDLLFVFGNRVCEDAYAEAAAAFWRDGVFKHVLVTGGPTCGIPQPEADVIADKIAAQGVPDDVIVRERRAANTGENVAFSLPPLDAAVGLNSIDSILAMGLACTGVRYLMTLEKHWPGPAKRLYAVNWFGRPLEDWPRHPDMRARVLGEWEKLETYRRRGFLAPWPPSDPRP